MLGKLLKKVNHWRRVSPRKDDTYKFSKKNRLMGFLVELFDPLTFLISAPEILVGINGIFGAIGLAFPPIMIGFFALEVAFFSVIACIMGYKYIKESGSVNKDIKEIQNLKAETKEFDDKLQVINKEIVRLEAEIKSKNADKMEELKNFRSDLEIMAAKKRAECEKAVEQALANKKQSLWKKTKKFWHNKFEEPYYKFKKKYPTLVGAAHYIFNGVLALLAVTGVISGIGYIFGISASSLGIITVLGLIPIGVTNPIGFAVLAVALLACAAVFMGRRMFFHAPVSEAKRRVPVRKKELAKQHADKKQELEVAEKYLEKLEQQGCKSQHENAAGVLNAVAYLDKSCQTEELSASGVSDTVACTVTSQRSALRASTLSNFSQVKSSSSRPKCP